MKHQELDPQKFFTDPDMPFYGYPKTEENIAAIKKLWADVKPQLAIGDSDRILYGSSGNEKEWQQGLMTMFFNEGYYL